LSLLPVVPTRRLSALDDPVAAPRAAHARRAHAGVAALRRTGGRATVTAARVAVVAGFAAGDDAVAAAGAAHARRAHAGVAALGGAGGRAAVAAARLVV